ncbi:MAG TPA: phospholipase D-like domain-containing protein [Kofleriaceae bacterium]|nr:phospholipase D-like domain-containing protein [Kofleriaceae bacterium]
MSQRAVVALALAALSALVACGGRGDDAADDDGPAIDAAGDGATCNPAAPRAMAPEVIVGPGTGNAALEERVVAAIDAATRSIDVHMYTFTVDRIANRLIAADQRGAPVRVILDQSQVGAAGTKSQLEAGGVEVKYASTTFPNAHAKYMVIDGALDFIISGNFTVAGFDDQRNYAVVDRDPDDVADLAAIFAADWNGQTATLDCTRLVVTPGDARARVLGFINAATATLDVEVYYISDSAVRVALIQAMTRGVAVRVLLADPADMSENATTATTLKDAGVTVKVLTPPVVHAKMIIADGVALIGSNNMSSTSLRENREIGVFVREGNAAAPAVAQFNGDWAAARAW